MQPSNNEQPHYYAPRTMLFIGLAAALLLSLYPVANYDIFWHLANGRHMLEQWVILNQEAHSYTQYGTTFNNHAWLAQAAFYAVYDLFGIDGLLGFKLLVIGATLWPLYRLQRSLGLPAILAVIGCLLIAYAIIYRLSIRPHLFSFLLLSLTALLLWRSRLGQTTPKSLLWLVPVILLWDLLHGSIYGLVLIAAFTGGTLLDFIWGREKPDRRLLGYLVSTLLLCLLASLLSPYGFLGSEFLHSLLGDNGMASVIGEFQRTPLIPGFYPFWIFWGLGLVVLVSALARREWTLACVLVPFLYLGWRYSRGGAPYVLVAAPLILAQLHSLLVKRHWMKQEINRWLPVTVLSGLVLYTLYYKFIEPEHLNSFGGGVHELFDASATLNFADAYNLGGNLFNSGNLGGVIALHAPERKIFIYNHHTLFGELLNSLQNPFALNRWQVEYALIDDYRHYRHLLPINQWAAVYWEPSAMLMVRRIARHRELIAAREIRYFNPKLSEQRLLEMAGNAQIAPRLLEEMANYLEFRRDPWVSGLLHKILQSQPEAVTRGQQQALLLRAARSNP